MIFRKKTHIGVIFGLKCRFCNVRASWELEYIMKFKEKYRGKSYICLTSFLHFCYKIPKNKHQE